MKVIGLTGGIASGKSTAARHLAELGAHVIDADRLGHRAYEPGTPGHEQVVAAFGPGILDGEGRVDRKALGALVFGDPDALARLTSIVWPEIRRLAEAEIERVRGRDPCRVIVLEAAVLLEAGWESAVDEIWAVVVDPETAIARATARDGTDPEAVRRRIAAQIGNEERRRRAHVVIDNEGDPEALRERLDREWARLHEEKAHRQTGGDAPR